VKALLSAVSISVLASGSALAADLTAPVVKGPLLAAFDWSGVYVGSHVGWGWQTTTFIDPGLTSVISNSNGCACMSGGAAATDARANSFLGGAQIGWMYQVGWLVVGNELDWSWARLNGNGAAFFAPLVSSVTGGIGGVPSFAIEGYSVSTKWTGTATTMIGIARGPWMFYSKAGAAWAHHEYALGVSGGGLGFPFSSGFNAGIAIPFSFAPPTTTNTLVGWTIGTGVKWVMSNNWFLHIEYDYMDFGSKGQNFSAVCTAPNVSAFSSGPCFAGTTTTPSTFNPTFNSHISEVKVGLNYKLTPGFLFW
jgi:outer membrane immunogenic protein